MTIVATLDAQVQPSRPLPSSGVAVGLLTPIVAVNAVAFLVPVAYLFRMSLNTPVSGGSYRDTISLVSYVAFLTDPYYLHMILDSIEVSGVVTLLTLAASYPIALFIHRVDTRWKNLLTVLTISPLLLSAVVRTYGWLIILGTDGLVNRFLIDLGILAEPLRLTHNLTGVIIGLTEILMPYMILALLAGFGRLDLSYEEAAQSLGARPLTVFCRVVLPLSLPGVALGCLLCFVLAISAFITPLFLGGGRVELIATEIYNQALFYLNWPLAAAMSIFVLVVFGLCLWGYGRLVRALD
jgi:putative spermidine/putrescine transport system permease protein